MASIEEVQTRSTKLKSEIQPACRGQEVRLISLHNPGAILHCLLESIHFAKGPFSEIEFLFLVVENANHVHINLCSIWFSR